MCWRQQVPLSSVVSQRTEIVEVRLLFALQRIIALLHFLVRCLSSLRFYFWFLHHVSSAAAEVESFHPLPAEQQTVRVREQLVIKQ